MTIVTVISDNGVEQFTDEEVNKVMDVDDAPVVTVLYKDNSTESLPNGRILDIEM